jgi:hypothetical protein
MHLGWRGDPDPVEQGLVLAEVALAELAQLLGLGRALDQTVDDDAVVDRADGDPTVSKPIFPTSLKMSNSNLYALRKHANRSRVSSSNTAQHGEQEQMNNFNISTTLQTILDAVHDMDKKLDTMTREYHGEIANLKRSFEVHQEYATNSNVEFGLKFQKLEEEVSGLKETCSYISDGILELRSCRTRTIPPDALMPLGTRQKSKGIGEKTPTEKAPTLHKYIKAKLNMYHEQARKLLDPQLPPTARVDWSFVFDLTKNIRSVENEPVLNAYVNYFQSEFEAQSQTVREYPMFYCLFAVFPNPLCVR